MGQDLHRPGHYPRYALGRGRLRLCLGWRQLQQWPRLEELWGHRESTSSTSPSGTREPWTGTLHANRCAGIALFGYCNWGWDNFELGHGDVDLIARWASTL